MDGMELYQELDRVTKQHQWCLKELRKSGSEYAEAERTYNTTKRRVCLTLRDHGMPVGMIEKVYKGEPQVADALFKFRIAEQTYKANQEAVLSTKLQLRLIDNQISREYASPTVGS
jgi:hypothetical protein